MAPVDGDTRYTVGGAVTGVGRAFGDADDNYMVTTIGRTALDGGPGDDILEDHNAEAGLIGGQGNDRLISRNGRDALWGGNAFGITTCTDDDEGFMGVPILDTAGLGCASYTNAARCGNYDDPGTFEAFDLCCLCGGGTAGATLAVTESASGVPINTPTTFDADGEIATLGDADTYVIYPTTEKSLYRPGFYPAYNSNASTKNRQFDCTKVFGFDKQDTLEFRLDDPTVEGHKFTDDDDECAFQVDGWELIWWLGDGDLYNKDTVEGVADVIVTSLDIYFSRLDRRVAICPFDDSTRTQGSIPEGDFSSVVLTDPTWPYFGGICADVDSSCIEYDVECPDLLNEMDVDDYMNNQSVLSWYGWF